MKSRVTIHFLDALKLNWLRTNMTQPIFFNFILIYNLLTMKMIPTILFMILFMLNACEKDEDLQPAGKEINISKTTREMIVSDNQFGIDLFMKVVNEEDDTRNIMISPTSIALALAMTYNGADTDTKTAMETTLRKSGFSQDEINNGYRSLMDALINVDPDVLLEIANSIWYRQGFNVLPDFISINRDFYDAEVNELDFSLPAAPEQINDWVADKTHDKITQIISNIQNDVVMYLINAIYFKGIWQMEFDKEDTQDSQFRLQNGSTVTVPMMRQEAALKYSHQDAFSMLELPYGKGNYSMNILLPDEGYTPEDILEDLTPENWENWISSLSEINVTVQLPKFKFEYKNSLIEELSSLGMGIAFSDAADFSKINGTGGLLISDVIHKTFVEVSEEGTEAAAVTAVVMVTSAIPGEPQVIPFIADHPFLFVIREWDTGTILFLGVVRNPA